MTYGKFYNEVSLLSEYQLYILGDMDIDIFNCDSHPPTEVYLDTLYSNNLLPIIS